MKMLFDTRKTCAICRNSGICKLKDELGEFNDILKKAEVRTGNDSWPLSVYMESAFDDRISRILTCKFFFEEK